MILNGHLMRTHRLNWRWNIESVQILKRVRLQFMERKNPVPIIAAVEKLSALLIGYELMSFLFIIIKLL